MPKIRFEFCDGTAREEEVDEAFAAKYKDMEYRESLVNRKEFKLNLDCKKIR